MVDLEIGVTSGRQAVLEHDAIVALAIPVAERARSVRTDFGHVGVRTAPGVRVGSETTVVSAQAGEAQGERCGEEGALQFAGPSWPGFGHGKDRVDCRPLSQRGRAASKVSDHNAVEDNLAVRANRV